MRSIGDLASLMMSNRENTMLRRTADIAAQEATLGKVVNQAQHLKGSIASVTLIERRLELLNQYQSNANELQSFFSIAQNSFDAILSTADDFLAKAALSTQVDSSAQIELFSRIAADAFQDIVNKLNIKSAEKYVFSGAATSTRPLPEGKEIISQLKQDISGVTSTSSLDDAIDDWFLSPNGVYQTTIYAGSSEEIDGVPIGVGKSIQIEVNASQDNIKTLLKGLAKIAVASDSITQSQLSEQRQFMQKGLEELNSAIPMMRHVQSLIGVSEEYISKTIKENENFISIHEADKYSLVSLDQFERLSEHQAIHTQINISYQILGQRAKNSLADYLR